jgi:hypothetical protein
MQRCSRFYTHSRIPPDVFLDGTAPGAYSKKKLQNLFSCAAFHPEGG